MIKRIFILSLIGILLSGCGFHLRQTQLHLERKYPTIILPATGSHTLHQALHRSLLAHDIQVLEGSAMNYPTLTVVSQEITTQPLVYGTDAELRRERLKMTVVFSFSSDKSQNFILSAIRDRQLNSKQHLGDNAEKILIENEMQNDILNQLLRYLANIT
jgi:outer membrane lipopolysaccharide assembly protein LptE/RlpB